MSYPAASFGGTTATRSQLPTQIAHHHHRGRTEHVSSDMPNQGLPMSSDTSRSPIPIDPETYRNLHKDLPRRMDASSNDLAGRRSNSREVSQDRSASISSAGRNAGESSVAGAGNFTQVQPFIMSPQNL